MKNIVAALFVVLVIAVPAQKASALYTAERGRKRQAV
jgi:hypothetical protein